MEYQRLYALKYWQIAKINKRGDFLEVKRIERGWAGHFCCANRCRFRRNTLLWCGNQRIVVSTVGLMEMHSGGFDTIGAGERYYETMAFYADSNDLRYHDIDVQRQVFFDSPWAIREIDADDKANDMHEAVCEEISKKLSEGHTYPNCNY